MNLNFKTKIPWILTFSYSREILQPVLEIWKGKEANVAAQHKLCTIEPSVTALRRGQYTAGMEKNMEPIIARKYEMIAHIDNLGL